MSTRYQRPRWRIRSYWSRLHKRRTWLLSHWSECNGYSVCAEVSSFDEALDQMEWRGTTTYEERVAHMRAGVTADVLITIRERRGSWYASKAQTSIEGHYTTQEALAT